MVLGLLAATSATSSGAPACARGLVNAEELAPAQIWRAPDFLSEGVVEDVLALLPWAVWYPCPRQEDKWWPFKQCSKLDVATHSSLATVVDKLGAAWGGRLNTSGLTHLPITWDRADDDYGDGASGAEHEMRHDYHHDVFPERPTDSDDGPDATNVIYLSEAPASAMPHLSGQTIFPYANVSVLPRRGTLLVWANRCEDGSPNHAATHGVGPYAGTHVARVAMHVPVSFGATANESVEAFPEHVGCTNGPGSSNWADTFAAHFGLLRIGTVFAAGLAAALSRARNRVRARAFVLHGLTRAGSALPQLPMDVVQLISAMVDASPNAKGSGAAARAATKKLASLGFANQSLQPTAGTSSAANDVRAHDVRWVRQPMDSEKLPLARLRRADKVPTSIDTPPASSAAWAIDSKGKKLAKIANNTKVVVHLVLKPPQLSFSLVATADGRVGYIQTKYLSKCPPMLSEQPVLNLTRRGRNSGARLDDYEDQPMDTVEWPWMMRVYEGEMEHLERHFSHKKRQPSPGERLMRLRMKEEQDDEDDDDDDDNADDDFDDDDDDDEGEEEDDDDDDDDEKSYHSDESVDSADIQAID